MTPAGLEHGIISVTISSLIGRFVMEQNLGVVCAAETGFLISRDPDTVLAPDCAFVSRSRLVGIVAPQKYFPGAPDLAIEVLSPSDRVGDVDEKVQRWLSAGCRSVWVVSASSRSVTIYRPNQKPRLLQEPDTVSDPDTLPGFSCPLKTLFNLGL